MPAEEVLTPPPDIDTSGWLTYQDTEHRFELKYPPDAQVKRDAPAPLGLPGFGTLLELPVPSGTTLERKGFFIARPDSVEEYCHSAATPSPQSLPPVRIASGDEVTTFWRTATSGVGGAQQWIGTTYFADHGGRCLALTTDLELGNVGLFPTGTVHADEEAESRTFAAMLSTFRWVAP